jgi:hypothetical protein
MNNKSYLAGFGIFVAMFFLSFWYVSSASADLQMGVDVNYTSQEYFSVDDYWFNESVAQSYTEDQCELTDDNQSLFVRQGTCDWTSIRYNTSDILGKPLSFEYFSENEDGNISATFRTYDYNGSIEETYQKELESNSTRINISDQFTVENVSGVEVELFLDDKNNNDQLPQMEQYELEVSEVNQNETQGLTSEDTRYMALFIFLISGIIAVTNFLS